MQAQSPSRHWCCPPCQRLTSACTIAATRHCTITAQSREFDRPCLHVNAREHQLLAPVGRGERSNELALERCEFFFSRRPRPTHGCLLLGRLERPLVLGMPSCSLDRPCLGMLVLGASLHLRRTPPARHQHGNSQQGARGPAREHWHPRLLRWSSAVGALDRANHRWSLVIFGIKTKQMPGSASVLG